MKPREASRCASSRSVRPGPTATEEEERWESMAAASEVKEWRAEEEEGEEMEAARVESRRSPMVVVVRRSTSTMVARQ